MIFDPVPVIADTKQPSAASIPSAGIKKSVDPAAQVTSNKTSPAALPFLNWNVVTAVAYTNTLLILDRPGPRIAAVSPVAWLKALT